MKPPSRQRRKRLIFGTVPSEHKIASGKKWTLCEKQQLLEGLKSYGVQSLERIQSKYLPHRHIEDIKRFVDGIKKKYKFRKPREVYKKAPIEVWLEEAEELTKREPNDLSFLLSEIFSVFGNLEPHDMLPHGHAPNWNEIYLYIAALLRGAQPLQLTPSNAMVLLSLVDSLVDDLRKIDSLKQRQLMHCKYVMLEQVKLATNKKAAYKWLQNAFDKDPFEMDPDLVKKPETTNDGQSSTSAPTDGKTNIDTTADNEDQNTQTIQENKSSSPSTSYASDQTNNDTSNQSSSPKNKAMYTINPFCIPIKYLKLKPAWDDQP